MRRKRVSRTSPWDNPPGTVEIVQVHNLSVDRSYDGLERVREEISGNVNGHPIAWMGKWSAVQLQEGVEQTASPISPHA
jgi:hypothetical protein